MNVHTDPLVDDYLRRLQAAAAPLPAHRRDELVSEIRDHLEEALRRAPADDTAAVRNTLERLGPPEEIAAAAIDAPPPDQRRINPLAIASVAAAVLWFAGLGAVLALVFGYRARKQIRNAPDTESGAGLAAVGIVLGWIGVAIVLAGVVLIAQHPNKH